MLGLKLRDEFKGRRLKGTAIELTNKHNTGATQVPASDFLAITYPTVDLLKTIEAAGPDRGRPITIKGERGQGKSHLMAALYHAFTNQEATIKWLTRWSEILDNEKIARIPIRTGMEVITESLHRQRYKFLWDLLFDQHPHGNYCKGKWEGLGDAKPDVPSDEIILELFQNSPTVLILDEFQTWYDGLTNTKQYPWKTWAFNFIQILSEIAKEHPELLVLVVSVRDGNTDAFQQIQRVYPEVIDFTGTAAKQDRLNLLLHRLFDNRLQIAEDRIATLINTHAAEYIRLRSVAPAEQSKVTKTFVHSWPYAPHLIQLLEDQVLMATHAQETRDLIRILADLWKRKGENTEVITAADFQLDDEDSGITALLDSVANQHHSKLREKALRNLEAVKDATANTGQRVPNLEGVIASLWLRSITDSNIAGADQPTLQVDLTKGKKIDDNAFQAELAVIIENSFNIHEDGNRFIFKEEENAQAKLISSARNDKLFHSGEDLYRLAKEIRYVISGPEEVASKFRVIVLPQNWSMDPWNKIDDSDKPANWDERIPLLVVPDSPQNPNARLGEWLKENLHTKRNVVRFLIPRDGTENLFADRNLVVLARAVLLADKWKSQNPEYGRLQTKYQKELRDILRVRFDRFAVISNWNFQQPKNCKFHLESHRAEGSKIPEAIQSHIRENLFVLEDFEAFVLDAAQNNESVGNLFKELREPRPNGMDCIPWLGEPEMKERLIALCAKGKIAINLRGMEYLQRNSGEEEAVTERRMRGRLGTGKHLDETFVLTPQAVPGTSGIPKSDQSPNLDNPAAPSPSVEPETDNPSESPDSNGESNDIPPNIFGGGEKLTTLTVQPTSALNLLGKIESFGISAGTQLQTLSLRVDKLTGAQLEELLKKLPDGMTYELSVDKEHQ